MRKMVRWMVVAGAAGAVSLFLIAVFALAPATAAAGTSGRVVAPQQTPIVHTLYLPVVMRVHIPPTPTPTPTREPSTIRLAFESKLNEAGANYEIYTIRADGTDLFNVSNLAGGDLDPDWSPGGTMIAWVHYGDNEEIYAANADSTQVRNLTNMGGFDRAPDWSPDGTKIAFHSFRDNRYEVYVMNADGTNQVRMTNHSCQSHDPVWSPDGSKIAYICGLDNMQDVFLMHASVPYSGYRVTHNEAPDTSISCTWAT